MTLGTHTPLCSCRAQFVACGCESSGVSCLLAVISTVETCLNVRSLFNNIGIQG